MASNRQNHPIRHPFDRTTTYATADAGDIDAYRRTPTPSVNLGVRSFLQLECLTPNQNPALNREQAMRLKVELQRNATRTTLSGGRVFYAFNSRMPLSALDMTDGPGPQHSREEWQQALGSLAHVCPTETDTLGWRIYVPHDELNEWIKQAPSQQVKTSANKDPYLTVGDLRAMHQLANEPGRNMRHTTGNGRRVYAFSFDDVQAVHSDMLHRNRVTTGDKDWGKKIECWMKLLPKVATDSGEKAAHGGWILHIGEKTLNGIVTLLEKSDQAMRLQDALAQIPSPEPVTQRA